MEEGFGGVEIETEGGVEVGVELGFGGFGVEGLPGWGLVWYVGFVDNKQGGHVCAFLWKGKEWMVIGKIQRFAAELWR